MPKRTNPFQRLIYSIQHQLSGEARVTESKLLPNARTGSLVEVDIVIETTTGGISLIVSVECTTSKSRVKTVEWVREMMGKHDDLPTNKLVLVSGSDFSQEAEDIAKAHNIEAITFSHAPTYNWSALIAALTLSRTLKVACFDISVRSWRISFPESEKTHIESIKNLSFNDNSRVFSAAGDPMGTIAALSLSMIRNKGVAEPIMRRWIKAREPDFQLILIPPQGSSVEDNQGNRLAVAAFVLSGHCDVESTPLSMSPAKYGKIEVAYGYAPDIFTGSTGDVLLFFAEREGEEPTGGISFSSDSGFGKAIFPFQRPSVTSERDG